MQIQARSTAKLESVSGDRIVFDSKEFKNGVSIRDVLPADDSSRQIADKSLSSLRYFDRLNVMFILSKNQVIGLKHSFFRNLLMASKKEADAKKTNLPSVGEKDFLRISFDQEICAIYKDETEQLLCALSTQNKLFVVQLDEFKRSASVEEQPIEIASEREKVIKLFVVDADTMIALTDAKNLLLARRNSSPVTLKSNCDCFVFEAHSKVLFVISENQVEIRKNINFRSQALSPPETIISVKELQNLKVYFCEVFANNLVIIFGNDSDQINGLVVNFVSIGKFDEVQISTCPDIFIYDEMFMDEDSKPSRFEFSYVHLPETRLLLFYGNMSSTIKVLTYETTGIANPLHESSKRPIKLQLADIDESRLPAVDIVGDSAGVVCGAFVLRTWLFDKEEMTARKTHSTFRNEQTGISLSIPFPPRLFLVNNGMAVLVRSLEDYRAEEDQSPLSKSYLRDLPNQWFAVKDNLTVVETKTTLFKTITQKSEKKTDPAQQSFSQLGSDQFKDRIAFKPENFSRAKNGNIGQAGLEGKSLFTSFVEQKGENFTGREEECQSKKQQLISQLHNKMNNFSSNNSIFNAPTELASSKNITQEIPASNLFVQTGALFQDKNQALPSIEIKESNRTPMNLASVNPFSVPTVDTAKTVQFTTPTSDTGQQKNFLNRPGAIDQLSSQLPVDQKSLDKTLKTQKLQINVTESNLEKLTRTLNEAIERLELFNNQWRKDSEIVGFLSSLVTRIDTANKTQSESEYLKMEIEEVRFSCEYILKICNFKANSPDERTVLKKWNFNERSTREIQASYEEYFNNLDRTRQFLHHFKSLADIYLDQGSQNHSQRSARQMKSKALSQTCLINKQLFLKHLEPKKGALQAKDFYGQNLNANLDSLKTCKVDTFSLPLSSKKTDSIYIEAAGNSLLSQRLEMESERYLKKFSELLSELKNEVAEGDAHSLNKTAAISLNFENIDSIDVNESFKQKSELSFNRRACQRYRREKDYKRSFQTELTNKTKNDFGFMQLEFEIEEHLDSKQSETKEVAVNSKVGASATVLKENAETVQKENSLVQNFTFGNPKANVDHSLNAAPPKQPNDLMKKIFSSNSGNYVEAISNATQIPSVKETPKIESQKRKNCDIIEKKEVLPKSDFVFSNFDKNGITELQKEKVKTDSINVRPQTAFSLFSDSTKKITLNEGEESALPAPLFVGNPKNLEKQLTENEAINKHAFTSPAVANKIDTNTTSFQFNAPSLKLQTIKDNSPAKDIRNATQVVSEVMLENALSKSTPDNKNSMVITNMRFDHDNLHSIDATGKNNLVSVDSFKNPKNTSNFALLKNQTDGQIPSNFEPTKITESENELSFKSKNPIIQLDSDLKANIEKVRRHDEIQKPLKDFASPNLQTQNSASNYINLLSNENPVKKSENDNSRPQREVSDKEKSQSSNLVGGGKQFKESLFKFEGGMNVKDSELTNENETKKLISNIELNSESENFKSNNPKIKEEKRIEILKEEQKGSRNTEWLNSPGINNSKTHELGSQAKNNEANQRTPKFQNHAFNSNVNDQSDANSSTFKSQDHNTNTFLTFGPNDTTSIGNNSTLPNQFASQKPSTFQLTQNSANQNLQKTEAFEQPTAPTTNFLKPTQSTAFVNPSWQSSSNTSGPNTAIGGFGGPKFGQHGFSNQPSAPQKTVNTNQFAFKLSNDMSTNMFGQLGNFSNKSGGNAPNQQSEFGSSSSPFNFNPSSQSTIPQPIFSNPIPAPPPNSYLNVPKDKQDSAMFQLRK